MEFELVRPVEAHIKLIFQWRNDPQTLKMSYHSRPEAWESFYPNFLKEKFCFPDLPPLFALSEGKPIAFLDFKPVLHPMDRRKKCCSVSINVAPNHRGEGIGSFALQSIQNYLKGYEALYSEVKQENLVSQKAFESAGFQKLGPSTRWIEDLDETFSIVRYVLPLKEEEHKVQIIAEAGSNWKAGKQNLAFELIDAARDAGADVVKFQLFRPETTYVKNAGALSCEEEIYTTFQKMAMPVERIADLASYCRDQGIAFMASTFSEQDFAALDPFVKQHKIASYEIGHIHLIRLAAQSHKPLILSTGAATEFEIEWAVEAFRRFGGSDLTLLQCTASYPAKVSSMNLKVIPWLKNRFRVKSGLSDHSRTPVTAPVAAVALGASVIEKHFTMDRALPGPDHAFAVTPDELKHLVCAVREVEQMRGAEVKEIDETELSLRHFACRGIQATRDIHLGEQLKEGENLALLRPGQQSTGLHARYLPEIEGKRALRPISLGSGIHKGDYA